MSLPTKLKFPFLGLFIATFLYAVWSYALTDPNLILSSWPPYWHFQQWMWQTFFLNHQLLTLSFIGLAAGLFAVYAWGWQKFKNINLGAKQLFLAYLLAISPLFFSYNALSHDVFNYIFNAKMVLVYHANPHVQVALDFVRDDWTRFMHNTHTPAPYGYGWTAISLAPYLVGFNKFLPTWLIFRSFEVLSVWLLFLVIKKIYQTINNKPLPTFVFWLVFANPLFLLEIISSQHNDLWMLAPAMLSLLLVTVKPKKQIWLKIIGSALLLGFSIAIKFSTLVLLPIWLLLIINWYWPKFKNWLSWEKVALYSSMLLFLPLLTARSQQFLPWYLLWSLVWLPFIKQTWWRNLLIAFSVTALLRYAPWLWGGEFTATVLTQQKWLLWGGGLGLWLISLIWPRVSKLGYNHSQ